MGYYRFDPTRGFENIFKQIQQVADEFNKGVTVETSAFKPRIDITEDQNSFTVWAELPGMDKSQVGISVNEERVLNIKGSKLNNLPDGRTLLRSERKYGEFSRSLQLPEEADIEKINAKFQKDRKSVV